jgi:hypothetical protein
LDLNYGNSGILVGRYHFTDPMSIGGTPSAVAFFFVVKKFCAVNEFSFSLQNLARKVRSGEREMKIMVFFVERDKVRHAVAV